MKINCYYDFPFEHCPWTVQFYFDSIFQTLSDHYPDFEFNKINSAANRSCFDPAKIYGHHHMIIENISNKKYFLISYWDKMQDIASHNGWNNDKLIGLFCSSGMHQEDTYYKPLNKHYTPFSYIVATNQNLSLINRIENHSNELRLMPDKLSFNGSLYLFRDFLSKDNSFNVGRQYLQAPDYIQSLHKNCVNLSINGAGEICYRDMEILGVGSALFRPKLTNQFHDPLIPDHHYISYDYDEIKNISDKNKFFKAQRDIMLDRWNEIKKDRDYIDFVAKNGRDWYERNVPIEMHASLAKQILDFTKLL
jgi:hypothetical protein